MYNAYVVPCAYKIPVTLIQNNFEQHKQHKSLFLIKYRHFWQYKIHSMMEGVSLLKAEAQPHLMDETCD
jgi:hypothetical protein